LPPLAVATEVPVEVTADDAAVEAVAVVDVVEVVAAAPAPAVLLLLATLGTRRSKHRSKRRSIPRATFCTGRH
jgi:hypothetical protein